MLDHFIALIGGLGGWAYLLVFLGAMLESAAFLGLIVPGESLVLVAGFFAAQGILDLYWLIATVAIGAVIGDSIGYELGRCLGRHRLLRFGGRFGLTPGRVKRAHEFFIRHGGKAVFSGRFVGFARALVPFLAGSSRMPYLKFLSYNALGAILWAVVVVLLGYFLGAGWRKAAHYIGAGGAIVGGFVVIVLGFGWLWRWAVRHEADIKRRWNEWRAQPRIVTLRERFAPHISFLRARLSPQRYLGLTLTLGALTLVGTSWLFGGIVEDVVSGDPLTVVDTNVANWFHAHATPPVTDVMLSITHLNGIAGIVACVVAACAFLIWKRDWYWLSLLAIIVPGGMLLNVATKYAIHRARPSFEDPILTLTTYSFPSGHVAASTLFYGALAAYLVGHVSEWRWRVLSVLGALLIILLVGLTRIYLGVHFLSDALAAFVESIAWLALCLTTMRTLQQRGKAFPWSRPPAAESAERADRSR